MNPPVSTPSVLSSYSPVDQAIWKSLSEMTALWHDGVQPPDAVGFLQEHPEVRGRKSVVLHLAYEEFLARQETGETIDPEVFANRFPDFKTEVFKLIQVHEFADNNAGVLEPCLPPAWPELNCPFLEFVLLEELGRGAFARVYLAEQPTLGNRLVALKVSKHGGAEARTLGRLDHPNIVPVHSVHHDSQTGLTAVCMPYLGNVTLCDALNRAFVDGRMPISGRDLLSALPLEEAPTGCKAPPDSLLKARHADAVAQLGLQMAEALAFVHGLGICHRDLKPSNVLLGLDGQPMLLDFNLSFDALTLENRFGGTLPYMSPEQLIAVGTATEEAAKRVDSRSDLFSLGVMLYQMLTGRHPFGPVPTNLEVEPLRAMLLQRQVRRAIPIRRLNRQVPASLARVVEDCLAYRSEDRPKDAAEVVVRLRACLQPKRWRVWASASAVVVCLMLLGGMAGANFFGGMSPAQRGHDAMQAGQYRDAIRHFNAALAEDRKNDELLYGRGRTWLQLKNWVAAIEDFNVVKGELEGRARASQGYCLNRLQQHDSAVGPYERAIELGYAPVEVQNNLGCCYLQRASFAEAKKWLGKALAIDPKLQAARYNRALVELRQAERDTTMIPRDGLTDINEALTIGPVTTDLLLNAAQLCMIAAEPQRPADPGEQLAWTTDAIKHLTAAVEQGESPKRIGADKLFNSLQKHEGFKALLQKPEPKNKPTSAVRLLDPAP